MARCVKVYRYIGPQPEIATARPTEREYVPWARIHDWLMASHIDKSYLESMMLTYFISPGHRFTSVNPRRPTAARPRRRGSASAIVVSVFVFILFSVSTRRVPLHEE